MLQSANGYVPALGTQFDLISGSSLTGRIASVELPPSYARLDARLEQLADRLRLTITAPLLADGFEGP